MGWVKRVVGTELLSLSTLMVALGSNTCPWCPACGPPAARLPGFAQRQENLLVKDQETMTPRATQAYCNRCGQPTKHDVIAAERRESGDRELGDVECNLYEMLTGRGCDSVSMRHTWRHTRSWPNWEDSEPDVLQYPPPIARRAPDWTNITLTDLDLADDDAAPVPTRVKALMREVYSAVQNGLPRLAAMGIRAALDAVMIDKVGDVGSFDKKMTDFQTAGYLSANQKRHLKEVLEAGHAAMHRIWTPSDQDVNTLLDIAESVIAGTYLHDSPVEALGGKLPPKTGRIKL